MDDQVPGSWEHWKNIGLDLDGLRTTPKFPKHCKPIRGGKPSIIREDGYYGADNSFTKNIVNGIFPAISVPPYSTPSTELIQQGGKTILLDLGPLGESADYGTTGGQVFEVRGNITQEASYIVDWSVYPWHPLKDTLEEDGAPKLRVEESYLTDHVWVARTTGKIKINMIAGEIVLEIPVTNPRFKVNVSDRDSGKEGRLGGIIDPVDLLESFQKVTGFLFDNSCVQKAIKGLEDAFYQAADILMDGTQDPEKPCEGISFGANFTTRKTSMGTPIKGIPQPSGCTGVQ
jgi:hypothetical protein